MIRDYSPDDWAAVADMIRTGQPWELDEIREMLVTGKALVYDNGQVSGMAVLDLHCTSGRAAGNLALFVAPEFRRQGSGGALFDRLRPHLESLQGAVVWTHFPTESTESGRFFTARGFAKVVDTLTMSYRGPGFPEPDLDIRPYRDDDFADYIRINNEAFADLRRAAGLDPFVFPDTATRDVDLRRQVHSRSDEIWLQRTSAEAIGLVELGGPVVDTVAVRPQFQGYGYGRQLTSFGVNRVLQRGASEVLLEVGAPNLPARRLYQSLGFQVLRSTSRSRLVVP